MPEDVIGKLARLTPDVAGIDRDEWLFRAGRASAKAPRTWKWAAGVLAVTQAATLTAWLAAPRPPAARTAEGTPAGEPVQDPPADEPYPADPDSYVVLARTFDPNAPPRPPAAAVPSRGTPLTAGTRSLLD